MNEQDQAFAQAVEDVHRASGRNETLALLTMKRDPVTTALLIAIHRLTLRFPSAANLDELSQVKSQLSRLAAASARLCEFPSAEARREAVENLLKEIVFSDIDNRVKQQ